MVAHVRALQHVVLDAEGGTVWEAVCTCHGSQTNQMFNKATLQVSCAPYTVKYLASTDNVGPTAQYTFQIPFCVIQIILELVRVTDEGVLSQSVYSGLGYRNSSVCNGIREGED